MATGAFPAFECAMHEGFVHPDFLFGVALVADLIACFFQQQLGNDAVSEVAILTFFFL